MFDYSIKTSLSYDQAVRTIEEKLAGIKFGVLFKLDLTGKLKEKGLNFDRNFIILEVCNPVEALNVLSKNIKAGYFLPCKIVVYEEGEGSIVGMIKPTELIAMIAEEDLKETALNVERKLIDVIEGLKTE